MQVYKFGGASIQSLERVRNVIEIVRQHAEKPLLLVVSAMGKTTNALEKVAESYFEGRGEEALQLFGQIRQQHLSLAKYLLVKEFLPCQQQLNDIFTEAEWLLHDKPVRSFDYYYDQIVCTGELMSTTLLAFAFREEGLPVQWMDVRDLLRTDDQFRDAGIDWEVTRANVEQMLKPALLESGIILTQGFIGSTDQNESTTLGREGSDYSAAIFANLLDAAQVTIWKDVEAVLNADPRQFEETQPLPLLSYEEVIEMAYYGAQVIHPKTIKPLFAKKIPLQVRSFLDPAAAGTRIGQMREGNLPPILVRKPNQVLMSFRSRDYSFVGEKPIGEWYSMLEQLHLKPNLIQNGAIQLMAVFDDRPDKIGHLAHLADSIFDVQLMRGLTLLTIRHYTQEAIARYAGGITSLLTQQTRETIQILYAGEPD